MGGLGGGPGSASSPSMAAPRLGAEAGAQWRLPAGEAAEGGKEEEEEDIGSPFQWMDTVYV